MNSPERSPNFEAETMANAAGEQEKTTNNPDLPATQKKSPEKIAEDAAQLYNELPGSYKLFLINNRTLEPKQFGAKLNVLANLSSEHKHFLIQLYGYLKKGRIIKGVRLPDATTAEAQKEEQERLNPGEFLARMGFEQHTIRYSEEKQEEKAENPPIIEASVYYPGITLEEADNADETAVEAQASKYATWSHGLERVKSVMREQLVRLKKNGVRLNAAFTVDYPSTELAEAILREGLGAKLQEKYPHHVVGIFCAKKGAKGTEGFIRAYSAEDPPRLVRYTIGSKAEIPRQMIIYSLPVFIESEKKEIDTAATAA